MTRKQAWMGLAVVAMVVAAERGYAESDCATLNVVPGTCVSLYDDHDRQIQDYKCQLDIDHMQKLPGKNDPPDYVNTVCEHSGDKCGTSWCSSRSTEISMLPAEN